MLAQREPALATALYHEALPPHLMRSCHRTSNAASYSVVILMEMVALWDPYVAAEDAHVKNVIRLG